MTELIINSLIFVFFLVLLFGFLAALADWSLEHRTQAKAHAEKLEQLDIQADLEDFLDEPF